MDNADMRVRRTNLCKPLIGKPVLIEMLTDKARRWFGERYGEPSGVATDGELADQIIAEAGEAGLVVWED